MNESAVDMMAREFMKTALPPVLTKGKCSVLIHYFSINSIFLDLEHFLCSCNNNLTVIVRACCLKQNNFCLHAYYNMLSVRKT